MAYYSKTLPFRGSAAVLGYPNFVDSEGWYVATMTISKSFNCTVAPASN